MQRSSTKKSVVLLLLGIACLIVGFIWFISTFNENNIPLNASLLFLAGIVLIYKTLIKTKFSPHTFELKDFWDRDKEQG